MAGQPTKYKKEYCEQATKLCMLGATDVELADFFEVTEKTLNNWKNTHPEFLQSLKDGKEGADAAVTKSLYQRATGYTAPDLDIRVIDGQLIMTTIEKHYPPDTTACIFWLKNRRKQDWRDIPKESEDEKKQLLPLQIEGEGKHIPVAESEQEISTERDERYKQ